MTVSRWTLTGADNQDILGDTHLPQGNPRGVVILSHGFKGYKDYGFMPYFAQRVADEGFIAHRFNFSHSGMTNNVATFERPDLFERDTWSKQIHDLLAVSEAAARGELPGDGLPQFWFGHSRGGVTTILAAAFGGEPTGIIPAASPDSACRYSDEQRDLMMKYGYLDSPSGRTGQNLRVGLEFLKEIEADPDAYDPRQRITRVSCPILVIHGDADSTVDVSAARNLTKAAGINAKCEIIEGASHTFNCPNPLEGEPPTATKQVADLMCEFISNS